MRPAILIAIFLLLLPAITHGQVRVRRGISIKLPRLHKQKPTVPAKKPVSAAAGTAVKLTLTPEKPNEVDEYFYIKWSATRKLAYGDFKCAKAPCRPLVSDKESDLLRAIYPNYQAFYNILEKSRLADSSLTVREDSIKKQINSQLDSLYSGYNYSVSVDHNIALSSEIDSPAASALTISPVIYNINETTFYYNIAALFSKFDSWMIIKSADILQHEQIHFDIFELYARQIRKQWVQLLERKSRGMHYDLTAELSPVYDKLYKELYQVQADFDEQTSRLTANNESLLLLNAKWSKTVREGLDALKDYENPEGMVTLKQ
ncbi:MAG: DUF922 domain-containing protein [Bacteroidota bacterium]